MTGFAAHPLREQLADFAEALAEQAREMLREHTSGAEFECKFESNPVTEFDRGVELAIRQRISEAYPDHGIVGEEYGDSRRDAEFVWVIDPIDGTRAFASGIPVFTSLIALCWNSRPVIGVIDAPVTGDRWVGVEGERTTRNGVPVSTRATTELGASVVAWGYPEVVLPEHAAGAEALRSATAWRVYGSGSYGVGRLASGALDLAVESGDVAETDVCAFVPVVTGAGGVCTDAFGDPITLHNGTSCLAAGTAELHAAALRVLNSAT